MFDLAGLRGPITPETLETLADRAAVCRLPQLYASASTCATKRWCAASSPPGAVIHGALGEATADEYIPKLMAGVAGYEATMHNITNQYSVVEGDDADVWSYAVALHFERAETGHADMAMGVHYRDQLTRTELGWSVTERHTVRLWTHAARRRSRVVERCPSRLTVG